MESIIKTLTDPGAWVSGILFSLIAAAIYRWFELLPRQLRGISRSKRLKSCKELRLLRENPMEITYAIGRANAHFVLFILMCFFYLTLLFFSVEYKSVFKESLWWGLLIASPIFVLEVFWLIHDSTAQRLIKAHGKLLKYRRL
jgi:hypothetical protein